MASIGQAITGIVGAGVGFLVAGPIGAIYGAGIGLSAGGILFPPKISTPSPEVAGLQLPTSEYGSVVKVVYGARKISGNYIWYDNFQTHKTKHKVGGKGGGGSSYTTNTYSASFAIGLCMGTKYVINIWAGKNKVSLGKFHIYDGTQTIPDSHLASFVSRAPVYKDLCYVVAEDYNLGSSTSLPTFTFEVSDKQVNSSDSNDVSIWSDVANGLGMLVRASPSSDTVIYLADETGTKIKLYYAYLNPIINIDAPDKVFNISGLFDVDDLYLYLVSGDKVNVYDNRTGAYIREFTIHPVPYYPDYPNNNPPCACTVSTVTNVMHMRVLSGYVYMVVKITTIDPNLLDPILTYIAYKCTIDGVLIGCFELPGTPFEVDVTYFDVSGGKVYIVYDKKIHIYDDVFGFVKKRISCYYSSTGWIPLGTGDECIDSPQNPKPLDWKVSSGNASLLSVLDLTPLGVYQYVPVPTGGSDYNSITGFNVFGKKFYIQTGNEDWNVPAKVLITSETLQLEEEIDLPIPDNVSEAWLPSNSLTMVQFGLRTYYYMTIYGLDYVAFYEYSKAINKMTASNDDALPPDVAKDVLTNDLYGLGLDISYLDIASFDNTDTYCSSNDLLVSMVFDSQMSILDVLSLILKHHNGYITYHDGKIFYNQLQYESPILQLSSDANDFVHKGNELPIHMAKGAPKEVSNKILVQYTKRTIATQKDSNGNITDYDVIYSTGVAIAEDVVDIDKYGLKDTTINLAGFTDFGRASKMAWLLLKKSLHNYEHLSFTLGVKNISLLPGDVIALTDNNLGINQLSVRVLTLNEDNKYNIVIECQVEQDSTGYEYIINGEDTSIADVPPNLTGDSGFARNIVVEELPAIYSSDNVIGVSYSAPEGDTSFAGASLYDTFDSSGNYNRVATNDGEGITGYVNSVGYENGIAYIEEIGRAHV